MQARLRCSAIGPLPNHAAYRQETGMEPIKRIPGRTLQAQVVDAILEQIRSGALALGDPILPERQLSEEMGVSRITIVRALDRLEADGWITRQQGRGTFVAEPVARPGPSLALMAAVPAHPSLFRSLIGMSEVVNAANGQLRLLGRFEGLGSEREMADRALRDGADGLIIYPDSGMIAPALYPELLAAGVPLVLIDRYFPDLATDRVVYDDEAAGATICGRLFDAGTRQLAVLSHREFDVTSVQGRLAGARRAAHSRGLLPSAVDIWPEVYRDFSPSRPNPDLREMQLTRLRNRLAQNPVDGLFAVNGDVAERVSRDLEVLMARGISVPVMRFGACGHQVVQGPAGARIEMAMEAAEELGRSAAEILVQRIAGGQQTLPQTTRIPMRIESES